MSSLVDRKEISDLPINGRRYYDFALLTPGVTRDGRFGLLSFRGTSGNFDNYMVEGNDDNQAYFSENRGRYRAPSTVSANAVQEFQVGQGAYQAEFGRASGGSVNMVLRSGANPMHADGFYYYRDQSFAARDPLASIKPPERRQQLGGSLSGPIRANKLFYFVNYDQQIRNFPLVIEDLTGALTSGKPVLPANPTAAQQAQYNTDLTAFNAGVAFVLKQFPGGAPGNLQSRTMGNNIALGKVDYLINNSNTLSTFFNYMRSHGDRAIQTPIVLGNVGRNGTDDVRIDSYNARLTTTLGPRRVNELRFQWSRDFEYEIGDAAAARDLCQRQRQLLLRPGHVPAALRAARRAAHAVRGQLLVHHRPARLQVRRRSQPRPRLHQQPDAVRRHLHLSEHARAGPRPGDARREELHQLPAGLRPGASTPTAPSITRCSCRTSGSRCRALTINYGLRWDKQTMPTPFAPNPAIPETQKFPTDWHSFGPRVGVAYDLTGKGHTVLRGGYGMYYGRIPNGIIAYALQNTGLTDPTKALVALTLQPTDPNAPVYPNVLPSVPTNGSLSTTVTRLAGNFSAAARAGLSRSACSSSCRLGLVLSASYAHTYGDHLEVVIDSNLPAPQFERTYQLPDGTHVPGAVFGGVIDCGRRT